MTSSPIGTLRFVGMVLAFVLAGFTAIAAAVWLVAYFSESPKQRAGKAVCLFGLATVGLLLLGLWLLGIPLGLVR